MKRTLLVIAILCMICTTVNAVQITPAQRKAKTEICNTIKRYGTNIKDDGEESLTFESNGTTYNVSIYALNEQTLYLCLTLLFGLPEEYDINVANIAAFHAVGNRPVCSAAIDGALMFSCEMYAKNAAPFIAVFPEMMEALGSSAENFQSEYENVAQNYVPSSKQIDTYLNVKDNEYIYPAFTTNADNKLFVQKVTLKPDCTILDMVSYNGAKYQWCNISRNSYISLSNGKRLSLTKAEGISYAPLQTDFPGYDSGREVKLNFKLYFPPLPKGTVTFDFSEGTTGWKILGITLEHGNPISINGKTIETSDHKCDCKAIELQKGQTIITKIFQPKSKGTYMYSSQEEYIEDADTGRKYYLLNSSIGFEGSPEISYSTSPITFYEVYPALPPNVKKVNISTGDAYYVKGLVIR